jgi:hypothetical protein
MILAAELIACAVYNLLLNACRAARRSSSPPAISVML